MCQSPLLVSWTAAAIVLGLALACHAADPSPGGASSPSDGIRLYVGTYTKGTKVPSKGIYVLKMDPNTGALSEPEVAAEVINPSFLALHPSHKFLYAVGEIGDFGGKKSGAVSAFSVDPASGKLTLLNQQPSGGDGPCYVSLNPAGTTALVANYGGGSIESLPLGADGKLEAPASFVQHEGKGADPKRQSGPHGHCCDADPAGRFALACDLGLDKVMVYRLDPAKSILTANDPPAGATAPGAGPRHLAFHPNGRFVYVISEMGNTITPFRYDAERGALTALDPVPTLPADFKGPSTSAEVAVHPSGKFVYGSNRGHDSLAAFAVDAESGKLTPIGHTPTQGKNPRHFAIAPGGRFLVAANQDGNNLVVFRIDESTGHLEPTGATAHLGSPVCVTFVPPTTK